MTTGPALLIVNCPYHDHWIRLGMFSAVYRSCPVCKYCVRCKAAKRPLFSRHTHGQYNFTETELTTATDWPRPFGGRLDIYGADV
jgi:hypothetical protein